MRAGTPEGASSDRPRAERALTRRLRKNLDHDICSPPCFAFTTLVHAACLPRPLHHRRARTRRGGLNRSRRARAAAVPANRTRRVGGCGNHKRRWPDKRRRGERGARATHATRGCSPNTGACISPTRYKTQLPAIEYFATSAANGSVANLMVANPCHAFNQDRLNCRVRRKKNPGKLNYGSPGDAPTSPQRSGELFKTISTPSFVHLPFRVAGPGHRCALVGEIELMFDNILAAGRSNINAGKVRRRVTG